MFAFGKPQIRGEVLIRFLATLGMHNLECYVSYWAWVIWGKLPVQPRLCHKNQLSMRCPSKLLDDVQVSKGS